MTTARLFLAGSTLLAALGLASCSPGNPQSTDLGAADMTAAPAPLLTQSTVPSASNGGGTMLTLIGQNFRPGATVTFGGVAATSVTVLSSTQITVAVPKNAGLCGPTAVVVTNPDGQSVTSTSVFAYAPGVLAFAATISLAMGTTPRQVITPDLDGDGSPDLITVNSGSGDVTIRFGMGNGSFGAATTINVGGGSPYAVAAADVTGDQKLDLVTAHNNSNNIKVIKATGNRTFMAPTATETYNAGAGPYGLALGDVDGTNGPDVVTANNGSSNVSLLLNSGGGTFGTQTTTGAGTQPTSVILARFVDTKLDYAVVNKNGNSVTIRVNSGGGFSATANTVAGLSAPTDLIAGDWNGDQKLDLAIANSGTTSVQIALGAGNGTFISSVAPTVGTGLSSRTLAMGDFNLDGKLDLAVANEAGGDVSILLGVGDGTFAAQRQFTVGATPSSVSVADLNKDGLPDFVTTDRTANAVAIRISQCQ